jgi:hypothetical protein
MTTEGRARWRARSGDQPFPRPPHVDGHDIPAMVGPRTLGAFRPSLMLDQKLLSEPSRGFRPD